MTFRNIVKPTATHLPRGGLIRRVDDPNRKGLLVQEWMFTIVVRLEGTMIDLYADPLDWEESVDAVSKH